MHHREYEPGTASLDPDLGSDSRLRIVRAAYPLFVHRGYDAVSMQEIADAVPIHKATLYHHFQNKDDLFLAVVRLEMTQLHSQIQRFIDEGGSAADQLVRVAMQVFRESQSDFGRLMTDARRHLSAEQQAMLVERCSDPWTLYEQIFATAVQSGELPRTDPTLAATMFVGLLYGQTWSLKTGRIAPPLDEQRARFVVDTLFAGLATVSPPGSSASLALTQESATRPGTAENARSCESRP